MAEVGGGGAGGGASGDGGGTPPEVRCLASMLPTMFMPLGITDMDGASVTIPGRRSTPRPLVEPQPRRGKFDAAEPRRFVLPPRASCRDCSKAWRRCSSSVLLLMAPSSSRLSSSARASIEASSCGDWGTAPPCHIGGSGATGGGSSFFGPCRRPWSGSGWWPPPSRSLAEWCPGPSRPCSLRSWPQRPPWCCCCDC